MTILRSCATCGVPSPEPYCPAHKPKPWATSRRREHLTVTGTAERKRREKILKRDMGICYVCDQPGADQVDHVVPLSEGGADEEHNLASIHAEPCHREKTAAEAVRGRTRGGGNPRSAALQKPAGVASGAGADQNRGDR